MKDTEAMLVIEDLQVKLFTEGGALPVLNHISLSVKPGEIVGIVGESGCGKSMLASSVMGLIQSPGKITGGRILLNGRDLTGLSFRQYQRIRGSEIAMIFQEPMTSLDPLMPCGRQIEEAIRAHEHLSRVETKRRAIEAIREVGIPLPEKV